MHSGCCISSELVVKVELSRSVAYTSAFVILETCVVYKNHATRAKIRSKVITWVVECEPI